MLLFETYYHIYNHANGEDNLFREEKNYHYFLQQWAKYIEPIADTYAYCLMPNHFHFLIKTKSEEDVLDVYTSNRKTLQGFQTLGELNKKLKENSSKIISLQFSHLFNGYTQAINKMYHRKGSLFMPNFKRKEISSDSYLTAIVCYIHRNPINHGFCQRCADWIFSSYHAYLSTKSSRIKKDEILYWFGGLNTFIEDHLSNKLQLDKTLFLD